MVYRVLDPGSLYKGKSYNDWAKDYFTWYFSADPDDHNDGPVVFLKSTPPLSSLFTSAISSQSMIGSLFAYAISNQSNTVNMIPQIVSKSMIGPNVMIGHQRLDIDKSQGILIPAIVAYFSQTESSDDYHTLKNFVRDAAENSDNPPSNSQIKINGLPITVADMKRHSLETDVFMLPIPDVEPGRSYKDYVEYQPLPPGIWPTVGGGYFFLLDLDPGDYVIASRVRGKKYLDGRDYFADLLYQISVN